MYVCRCFVRVLGEAAGGETMLLRDILLTLETLIFHFVRLVTLALVMTFQFCSMMTNGLMGVQSILT